MAIVNAKEMLLKATEEKYAVGAFNCTNLIQMEAVIEAAVNLNAPLILQTSVAPSKFLDPQVIAAIYKTLAASAPIPICLHLDHCSDVEFCKICADAGYTNIMIDASRQNFRDNIRKTKQVCEYCHSKGDISVEGELGTLFGIEDDIEVPEGQVSLCDPEQALEFVTETGVDTFAPSIGTAHGIYRTKYPKLNFDRLEKIATLINGTKPQIPLVIHGGTGLQPDVVKKLISLGGAKYNVSTDLKHVLIDTTYGYISYHSEEYDPGMIDRAVKDAIKGRIEYWIKLLGCAGKA